MTVSANLEVVGLKETLRTLNDLDKKYRRQVTRDYKEIVHEAVEAAIDNVPEDLGVSKIRGTARTWKTKSGFQMMPIRQDKLEKWVVPIVSGKKPREFRGIMKNSVVFGLRWKSSQATLIEMAGKGKVPTERGRQLARALTQAYGRPGRVLWRAYERHADDIQENVADLVQKVMRKTESEIAIRSRAAKGKM
jgi:hypothetical protein